jgi:hypothetical protein
VASSARGGPGDALAQPTRARLFARLASLGRPAGTEELAEELMLHPSGVRVHLERLEAGVLLSGATLRHVEAVVSSGLAVSCGGLLWGGGGRRWDRATVADCGAGRSPATFYERS